MFEDYYTRMARRGNSLADVLQRQSEAVVNATWMQSTSYRPVIVKHIDSGLPSFNEEYDEILDAHFEQKSKYNITGDEVAYWLRFRPRAMQEHPEIAIGSYVSIPDCEGDRETWLIVHIEDDGEQKWLQVLKTNWVFKWIVDGKIYECLGCQRYASSYNSGSFEMDRTTSVENMNGLWLPTNMDSDTLGYNQRLMVSAGSRKTPICWEITKVETTIPVGLTKFTVSQVAFDPIHDNPVLGIANYYGSSIPLEAAPTESEEDDDIVITYNGTKPTVKVGSSKLFTADLLPTDTRTLTWSIVDDGNTYDVSTENYTLIATNRTLELKVAKNYNLIGRLLTVQAEDEDGVVGEVKVEVV